MQVPVVLMLLLFMGMLTNRELNAQVLRAGTGKANIGADKGNIHDSLYAKALVIENKNTRIAIITMDIITIGGLGRYTEDFLPELRKRLQSELGINGKNILINADHNHRGGQPSGDLVGKTVLAVKMAIRDLEPVKIGAGSGFEDRITMNRRVKLKNGDEYTIRAATPDLPDDEIVAVKEFDPEIGILKIDRLDGSTKAVLYNFSCHPLLGVPDGGITAAFPGFASGVIEDQLSKGAMALFLQGAGGDIIEVNFKDVNRVSDSEPVGRALGLSTLKALRDITTSKNIGISVINETVQFPLRTDVPERLKALEQEEIKLLSSLRTTSLNLKTFIPLMIKYSLSPVYPMDRPYIYLQEKKIGIKDLEMLDRSNRNDLDKYIQNVLAMEKITLIEENKLRLRSTLENLKEYGGENITVDIQCIRIGDFVVVTFPGEAFVQVGLNIKKQSPFKNTFLAAYSNGYFHYAPTADAYGEWGYEDKLCILAPEWQKIFEEKVSEMLKKL